MVKQRNPKKVISNDLDLHGFGDKRIGMGLTLDQKIEGMVGKEGIDTWGLAGFGVVFGPGFVFKNVGAFAKDSALFKAQSFHFWMRSNRTRK